MAHYVQVKPELLRWAVDRSGLPRDAYANTLDDWLNGDKKPTYNQLEAFARRAMVPVGYLFLEHPPNEELPVPDYRTRHGDGVRQPSPNLIETIFEMKARQEWMREFLLDHGHDALPFVGSASVGDAIGPLAERMRNALRLVAGWAERQPSWEAALRSLREQIEDAGILIFFNGIVGNNTSRKLDPDEFQGFVLVDRVAPLVFVNASDFKVAQMFTIAHELAHLWVGQSALFDLIATEPANYDVEKYCNAVAAEFLIPSDEFEVAWAASTRDVSAFTSLARRFKVSPVVIARVAKNKRRISSDDFFAFYRNHMSQEKARQSERSRGGDFWRNQGVRLGRRFGRAVISAVRDGRLTYSQAYDLTQLHGRTFDKYAQVLGVNIQE